MTKEITPQSGDYSRGEKETENGRPGLDNAATMQPELRRAAERAKESLARTAASGGGRVA